MHFSRVFSTVVGGTWFIIFQKRTTFHLHEPFLAGKLKWFFCQLVILGNVGSRMRTTCLFREKFTRRAYDREREKERGKETEKEKPREGE